MSKANKEKPSETPKAAASARHRSPNFPAINLGDAIDRVNQLYQKDKLHQIPVAVAHQRWGYKPYGSQGEQIVAALKSFGLAEVDGTGKSRTIRVSESARRVLLNATDAGEVLKRCAVNPAVYRDIWDKYGKEGLPSDEVLKQHLVFEKSFNEASVSDFIANFRKTISIAKLDSSDKIDGDDVKDRIKVGDFIQWESAGVAQFTEPKKVIGFDDNGSGQFLFVEGERSGIPVEQAVLVDPPKGNGESGMNQARNLATGAVQAPPLNPNYKPATGLKQDAFISETGEITVRWPAVLASADKGDLSVWLDRVKRRIMESVETVASKEPAQ